MPATALPPLAKLEGAGAVPNSDDFRASIGDIRRYLAGLLGVTGEVADAVAALGLNKVSGDCLQTRVSSPAFTSLSVNPGVNKKNTPPVFVPKSLSSLILVKCTVSFYQDSSISGNANFKLLENATVLQDFSVLGRQMGTAVLSAIISNTSLAARNIFLTGYSNLPNNEITKALWEISEYVA